MESFRLLLDPLALIEHIYHHHHVALVARISLALSRHSSLSFIAPGRSSGQHPVSSHSCWMYVRAGRPAFAWPCVGVHKSTSLMSSSLLLLQCPVCLVRLTWIVFVIGGRWSYSWCLVGCCCVQEAGGRTVGVLWDVAACNLEQEHIYIYIYIFVYKLYIYIFVYKFYIYIYIYILYIYIYI